MGVAETYEFMETEFNSNDEANDSENNQENSPTNSQENSPLSSPQNSRKKSKENVSKTASNLTGPKKTVSKPRYSAAHSDTFVKEQLEILEAIKKNTPIHGSKNVLEPKSEESIEDKDATLVFEPDSIENLYVDNKGKFLNDFIEQFNEPYDYLFDTGYIWLYVLHINSRDIKDNDLNKMIDFYDQNISFPNSLLTYEEMIDSGVFHHLKDMYSKLSDKTISFLLSLLHIFSCIHNGIFFKKFWELVAANIAMSHRISLFQGHMYQVLNTIQADHELCMIFIDLYNTLIRRYKEEVYEKEKENVLSQLLEFMSFRVNDRSSFDNSLVIFPKAETEVTNCVNERKRTSLKKMFFNCMGKIKNKYRWLSVNHQYTWSDCMHTEEFCVFAISHPVTISTATKKEKKIMKDFYNLHFHKEFKEATDTAEITKKFCDKYHVAADDYLPVLMVYIYSHMKEGFPAGLLWRSLCKNLKVKTDGDLRPMVRCLNEMRDSSEFLYIYGKRWEFEWLVKSGNNFDIYLQTKQYELIYFIEKSLNMGWCPAIEPGIYVEVREKSDPSKPTSIISNFTTTDEHINLEILKMFHKQFDFDVTSQACFIWKFALIELIQMSKEKEKIYILMNAHLNPYTKNMTMKYYEDNKEEIEKDALKFATENSEYLKNPSVTLYICLLYYMSITMEGGVDMFYILALLNSKMPPKKQYDKTIEHVKKSVENMDQLRINLKILSCLKKAYIVFTEEEKKQIIPLVLKFIEDRMVGQVY